MATERVCGEPNRVRGPSRPTTAPPGALRSGTRVFGSRRRIWKAGPPRGRRPRVGMGCPAPRCRTDVREALVLEVFEVAPGPPEPQPLSSATAIEVQIQLGSPCLTGLMSAVKRRGRDSNPRESLRPLLA